MKILFRHETPRIKIQDRGLLRRFESLNSLPEQHKTQAEKMLDLLILNDQFKELLGAGPVYRGIS